MHISLWNSTASGLDTIVVMEDNGFLRLRTNALYMDSYPFNIRRFWSPRLNPSNSSSIMFLVVCLLPLMEMMAWHSNLKEIGGSKATQRAIVGNSGPIKNDIKFPFLWWLKQLGISLLTYFLPNGKALARYVVVDEGVPINMWLVTHKHGGRLVETLSILETACK